MGTTAGVEQWGKRDDMLVHATDPYNAEPPGSALADRPLTPLDAFYVRNHGPVPEGPGADGWRITVDGLVARPLELTLRELREGFAAHELTATLQCAGNRRRGLMEVRDIPGESPWGPGATSTARWTGVRLCDVLAAAGLREEAAHVAFAAPDVSPLAEPPQPYEGSVPAGKALSEEVLLAWAMNGQPLPAVHGAPLRVVVPGWIGARSVKWLRRITARREPADGWFQARSYRLLPPEADLSRAGPGDGLSLGPVALNCAVLGPADGARLSAGPADVTGYAYAGGGREVARVDVSADGGRTWRQAELDAGHGPWTWRLWRATLDLPPGTREITARAWDTTGAAQPESPGPLWNPGGYANNSWSRVRVRLTDGA